MLTDAAIETPMPMPKRFESWMAQQSLSLDSPSVARTASM
jgi:hypothetical protein